jgi:hypothetical protein
MNCRAILLTLLPLFLNAHAIFAEKTPITVEVELGGKRVEGTPLAWSKSDVFLLARDGNLLNFHPNEAKKFRKTSDHFLSFSPNDMKHR